MGEEAAPRETLSDNILIGMPHLAETAEMLANRRGLTPSASLEELLDHLFGLSCRDQEERAFDPKSMAGRRQRGFELAKSMRNDAVEMLAGLQRLHDAWREFDQQVGSMPTLLEAIFNVDTGDPENIFLPAEISILGSLFRTSTDAAEDELQEEPIQPPDIALLSPYEPCPAGFWEAVDRRLQAVADLPIQSQLPRGPVPNATVRDALMACRSFWTDAGRQWSMAGLKFPQVRQDNKIDDLSGTCEEFVADALTTSGIKFNLHELHSAWEWVDATVRRRKTPAPTCSLSNQASTPFL